MLRFEGADDILAVVILDTWDEKAGLVKLRSVWLYVCVANGRR